MLNNDVLQKHHTTKYDVFPGIQLFYHDIHVKEASLEIIPAQNQDFFEIIHCREGRMECKAENNFYYVSAGDLLITQESHWNNTLHFPFGHYHGITIHVDVNKTPKCLSCFLENVSVQPRHIKEKFCQCKPYFIARSNASFEHIFSELYTVPDNIKLGYFKIKILELMLFLSVFHVENNELLYREVSPYQVKLAKEVCEYLTENMDERITLDEVSAQFGMSSTKIKNAFKQVYGVPFYSFLKAQKMESAAYMLEYTGKNIIDIANEHGYENSSKFANAFKAVKGMTPGEYRAAHANRKNI